MGAIITLTTDFGLTDAYVAAMKGVILGINPEAQPVDICHDIMPQNIPQAAFILSTVHEFFPPRTIHLVIVDPGVGTERRAVILRTPAADFIAPDNGVLSYVISRFTGNTATFDHHSIELTPELEAVAITNPKFWRSPVSATFHGRDIFAPVAAHLSLGTPIADFGEAITSLTCLPLAHPHQAPDGTISGQVVHVDSFGNLITNIRSNELPEPTDRLTVKIAGRVINGLSRTYGTGEGLLALIGSSDYLEISLKDGDARSFLNSEVGDEVIIQGPASNVTDF